MAIVMRRRWAKGVGGLADNGLTASSLRAGNLSVRKIATYRDALRQQMVVWNGLFIISLSASLLLIVGKITSWSIPVIFNIPFVSNFVFKFDAIVLENCLIVVSITIILFRAISVGNGILSLLRLSAELAISEAQARDEDRNRAAEANIQSMKQRDGYGPYVDLKH